MVSFPSSSSPPTTSRQGLDYSGDQAMGDVIEEEPAIVDLSRLPARSRPLSSTRDQLALITMRSNDSTATDSRPLTMWSTSTDLSPYSSSSQEDTSSTFAPPTPNPEPPTRHGQFWMYDGSIVLHVESTLFRVHQTVLASHSEVFRDLFTVPQPAGEEMIEECHVVRLHDTVKDFVDLLKAVYVPDHFEFISADSDLDSILSFIDGILRLSTKYMIRYIRQRCISLLLAKLPCTFAGYEAKSISNTDRYRSDTIMRAITLAKENSVLEVLPYAYYCLSRFPHKRFLKDRPTDISWRDKMIVLIGRERLQWAQMSLSHKFLLLFQRSPVCQSPLCAHARGPHAEWHEIEKGGAHPLKAYEGWHGLNICADCVAYCQARHLEGRKEVWKYLPTWFELPAWEDLKSVQNC